MLVGALFAVGCSGRSSSDSERNGPASGGSTAANGGTSSAGTPATGGTSSGGTPSTGGTGQSGMSGRGGGASGCRDMGGPCEGVCSTEGATCSGQRWDDDAGCIQWSLICCNGQWNTHNPAFDPVCPGPLMPGDPFPCVNDRSVTCVAGESYCRHETEQPSNEQMTSCEPLCEAADCSCFCTPDDTGLCRFIPDDAATASVSECGCFWTSSPTGPQQIGGVEVACTYIRQ